MDKFGKYISQPLSLKIDTDAVFEGANAIARITGCGLTLARETMDNLPQTLSVWLYQHQAYRLVQELKTALVVSNLLDPTK